MPTPTTDFLTARAAYSPTSSPERDALAAAGKKALLDGIGEAAYGTTSGGLPYRGLRINRVPEELEVLQIPVGAVITAVNGVPVNDGPHLLEVIASLFVMNERVKGTPKPRQISRRKLIVEFLADGKTRAIEYRVL